MECGQSHRGWTGGWIWQQEEPPQAQTTLLFSRTFFCERSPASVSLKISAGHIYEVYLNSQPIGLGPSRSSARHRYYDQYELTGVLTEGANQIVCVVHHYGLSANPNSRYDNLYEGPGGLLLDLSFNGESLGTGEAWSVCKAPGWKATERQGHRFHPPIHQVDVTSYDAGLKTALAGGDLPWQKVRRIPWDSDCFAEPTGTGIPRLEELSHAPTAIESIHSGVDQIDPPVKWYIRGASEELPVIHPSERGTWLQFRLPWSMGGRYEIELEVAGDQSAEIDVYCGEGAEISLCDYLIFRGRHKFHPLDWRGGDRVAVHFKNLSAPVRLISFVFKERRYPFAKTARFVTDSPLVNDVWEICQRTARQCTVDHLIDSWREQSLWVEDIFIHAPAIAVAFGDMRPVQKVVRQTLLVMNADGVVPVPGPAWGSYSLGPAKLPWSGQALALPLIIKACHEQDPCQEFLAFCFPFLKRSLAFFAAYENNRGLLDTGHDDRPALGPFGGWGPQLREGVPTALNSFYSLALDAAGTIAEAVGDKELSELWHARGRETAALLRKEFWDPEKFVVYDGERDGVRLEEVSWTVNAWAALAGVVPASAAGSWAEALRRRPDVIPPESPYDASLWLMALEKMDLELPLADFLISYYGGLAKEGFPCLPEFWMSDDRGMSSRRQDSSRCHPYGCGPLLILCRYVAGVRCLRPGWSEILICPRRVGLQKVRYIFDTPRGEIEVEWEYRPGRWDVWIHLPEGAKATLELPRLGWNAERLTSNGRCIWEATRWEHFPKLARRSYRPEEDRIVTHSVEGAARHHVCLETY